MVILESDFFNDENTSIRDFFDKLLQLLRSDTGIGEYVGKQFQNYPDGKLILCELYWTLHTVKYENYKVLEQFPHIFQNKMKAYNGITFSESVDYIAKYMVPGKVRNKDRKSFRIKINTEDTDIQYTDDIELEILVTNNSPVEKTLKMCLFLSQNSGSGCILV